VNNYYIYLAYVQTMSLLTGVDVQQQPGSMEAYNRMVALYQKMNQPQQSEPSNPSKQ
jgi:hypothetical protein